MMWPDVDATRQLLGTLALPLEAVLTFGVGSSEVRKYREPAMDRLVVGKRVVVHDRPLADALREPVLQHRLRHDHLVPVITVADVFDMSVEPPARLPDAVEIITPYYPRGSVYDALTHGESFDVVEAMDVARAAALGLAELHRQGIVHRDVKSPNIFLTDDRHVARVGDLGEAHELDDRRRAPGIDSPVPWIAPEQVASGLATPLSDLYGLGVVLVEMLRGGLDLHGFDRGAAHRRMCRGQGAMPRRSLAPPPWTPPEMRRLIRRLTEPDLTRRQPQSASEVADLLARSPAVGWYRVRDEPPRWEGGSRRTGTRVAIDTRYLPRKTMWELQLARETASGWTTFRRLRSAQLDDSTLGAAFDAALTRAG